MIPKRLGSFSSVFMTHVLPNLRRMTDLMICPEAKFRTLLESLGLLYCPAVLRLIGTLYCYPLGNWPSMGLGPESFVEWSTCLWTWSMSSDLCKEWWGLHDIHVHGFHISFFASSLPCTTCPPQWAWIVGFWRLVKSVYLVFVSYDRRSFLYMDMRMGGQRTWCCKEKHGASLFPTRYVTDSHGYLYTSSSFG